MGLKKQFAVTLASVGLGAALIGGGTFAWFNATAAIEDNTFAAGTLKIGAKPASAVFNIQNLKPGDWMVRTFQVENEGTLSIDKLLMSISYEEYDAENNNPADDEFGDNLEVYLLTSDDPNIPFDDRVIIHPDNGKTLKELRDGGQIDISSWGTYFGALLPNDTERIFVGIKFVETGEDQNHLQGDSINLTFNLEGKQGPGLPR